MRHIFRFYNQSEGSRERNMEEEEKKGVAYYNTVAQQACYASLPFQYQYF